MKQAVFLALVSTLLISCDKKSANDPRTLRMTLGSDPPVLDPQLADTGISVFLLDQVASTLFAYDAQQNIRTADAESYQWNNNGNELLVKLRGGLTWSDGAPLQACQYRDAILRALDPKTPSSLADVLFVIRGAAAFKAGKGNVKNLGVTCNDAKGELRFQTETPYTSKLLHALAFVVSAPVRLDEIKRRGNNWLLPVGEGASAQPGLASGAFRIKSWTHDRRVVLESRQLHEKNLPSDRTTGVDFVDFAIVKDGMSAWNLYSSGDIDILDEVPTPLLPKAMGRSDRVNAPYFTTYMIGFSLRANPALQDKRVRQALAYSFNQDEVPQLLGGGEEAARGWVPPLLLPESIRPHVALYQPELARRLLKEAGYGPKKKLKLKLIYNSGERHQLLMERAANQWKSQLGVEVELNPMEWKVYVARVKSAPADLYRYAWAAVYPDPVFFLELFLSDSASNFGHWSNADFDRLVRQLSTVAVDRRDAAFWKDVERAQKILVSEDPGVVPLYHYVRNALVNPGVKGLEFNWRGMGYLRSVRKESAR
ncbi:MAG: peptide ABC transporter substrate-binding protein [Bdellovibrionales bacterium]|nr:peptide ABC transporter substrate-binding protein [Bdellovibrionales bacterium]